MRRILIVILFIPVSSSFLYSQDVDLEKRAVIKLLDSIFTSEYSTNKAEFSGKTENDSNMILVFEGIDYEPLSIMQEHQDKTIDIKHDRVKLKKHRFGNRPTIQVYPSMKYADKNLVYIKVYKRKHYVGHHLFIFERAGRLIDVKTEWEII